MVDFLTDSSGPENGCLEDEFPFGKAFSQGLCWFSGRVYLSKDVGQKQPFKSKGEMKKLRIRMAGFLPEVKRDDVTPENKIFSVQEGIFALHVLEMR